MRAGGIFVADGYNNRRIIVFDADTGAFKRMWGAFGNVATDPPPVAGGRRGRGNGLPPPDSSMERITLAGFPPTMVFGGTSLVTTEPAATTEFSPKSRSIAIANYSTAGAGRLAR
jgi:hypothetical protein